MIINFNYNTSCHTKKGIIGLSKKSEKKVYNLLTQLNQVYSLKRCFSIKNNDFCTMILTNLNVGEFKDIVLKENQNINVPKYKK